MDDLTWLAGTVDLTLLTPDATADRVRGGVATVREQGLHGLVVAPSHLPLIPADVTAVAVVGFPTGRHHTLVKAAEARLAVETGATEIWLTVDAAVEDPNALLAEIVAVREAVPPPVNLGVIVEAPARADVTPVCRAAQLAGAERLVTATGWHPAGTTGTDMAVTVGSCAGFLPVTAVGAAPSLAEAVDWLDSGADRLALAGVGALLSRAGE
ncbi:deoxyribose-phosphate aldolase [Corynebacterium halotolerans]|uniref:Deoxyribose-phosphate aldolase n=1 Tax=Corynebacterium halotolerans YIM 70093 = DSM 44683 TaxID=1121362 RepID=M1P417_9CORY|nr:deoxyribose-phosphate aldolase [Corynebacterium halotolerans]AGF71401.1 deoxyribose-phosphate aldolase [Corynebacterium halotolerans YIM 70093 = DSM 44683]